MNIKPIKGLIREFFNSMDNIISDEYLLNYHILLEDSVLFYKYPQRESEVVREQADVDAHPDSV